MQISVVSDVIADCYDGYVVDTDFVRDYIRGMNHNLIVPGVTAWNSVTTTYDDEGRIVITADLATEPLVADNDPSGYEGQAVNEQWIREYITGADAYWLVPGALVAGEITFS